MISGKLWTFWKIYRQQQYILILNSFDTHVCVQITCEFLNFRLFKRILKDLACIYQ